MSALRLQIPLVLTLLALPAAHSAQIRDAGAIQRAMDGLRPPVSIKGRVPDRWTIAERMKAHHVPGVSIALIDGGRVAWSGAFGVKETGSAAPVTPATLFQAQSISKAVTATAALALTDSGALQLDADVNRSLRSWKIPDSSFTSSEKVTIRRILSHSAGLTVGGFNGYTAGEPLPTLRQILDGERPANSGPVLVDTVPGTRFRYSGGGLLVLQQLLLDVTGESFPSLMQRLVFGPIGMSRSTFDQPLPANRWQEAASGHRGNGEVVPGRWPVQPELAAGGLWTTPGDLAAWAIAISDAWSGRSSRLLSQQTAREMLAVQKPPLGLGVYVEGDGRSLSFSHSGSIWGFRASVVMYPDTGQGVVIMTNGDGGDALIRELHTSIASEFGWPTRGQREREAVALTSRDLDGLAGVYVLPPGPTGEPVHFVVTREGTRLFAQVKGIGSGARNEIFAATSDSFFQTSGLNVHFTRDALGRGISVAMAGIEGRRIP